MNHIWTQILISYSSPHEAHEKSKGCFCQKRGKCSEIAKGNFSKIAETARQEPPR